MSESSINWSLSSQEMVILAAGSGLFALLAPGSVLYLPAMNTGECAGKWLTLGGVQPSTLLVHTLVFAILFYFALVFIKLL